MLKSMTGYGRATTSTSQGDFLVEIKSVNSKGIEINLKNQYIPRDKEIEVKQFISSKLGRGTIDVYITLENNSENIGRQINVDVFKSYKKQVEEICEELNIEYKNSELISTLLRMPDIIEVIKTDNSEIFWPQLEKCIGEAVDALIKYREIEGATLEDDIRERVSNILEILDKTENLDNKRNDMVRNRLASKLEEWQVAVDENRFEQELLYYLEKIDITEEKVRLKQHCQFFIQTIDSEPIPGKKMGFISQEIGREINTLGSKANYAEIQRLVVEMKEELEKIKEQSLNII